MMLLQELPVYNYHFKVRYISWCQNTYSVRRYIQILTLLYLIMSNETSIKNKINILL